MRGSNRERGAVLPLVAILLPVLLVMTAFAVDLGRQRSSRRTMQARADVIALDMVRIINGRETGTIIADPATATSLSASASRNEIEVGKLTVTWGTWSGSAFTASMSNVVPNAVQVRAQEDTDYLFKGGSGHADRSAIATAEGIAEFSIGSYAAGLQSQDSAMLGSLVGDALNANVVGYGGLVSSDVSLQLLGEELVLLGAIGSPDELFSTDVSVSDLYLASANALRNSPGPSPDDLANATVLQNISTQVTGVGMINFGDVFHVEQGGEDAALDSSMNALDLLSASAFLANGSNALGAPAINLNIPLVGQVATACTTIEPPNPTPCNAVTLVEGPVTHRGPIGTGTSTRQVAVRVGFQGGLAPLLNAKTQVNLDSAVGRGEIEDIRCGTPTELDLSVETGLIETELKVTAQLQVLTFLLAVDILVTRPNGGGTIDHPSFDMPDDVGFVYEGGGQDIGLKGLQVQVNVDTNIVPALLKPTVNGLLTPIVAGLVNNVIGNTLLTAVDQNLLSPLSDLLGLNVAGADVVPLDADCTNARLVA